MNDIQQTTLWLAATRYYMGRTTYAVEEFCELLIAEWPNLDEQTKALIQRDITEEIKRDDEDRATGMEYRQLGGDCDRDCWDRVAKLWLHKNI